MDKIDRLNKLLKEKKIDKESYDNVLLKIIADQSDGEEESITPKAKKSKKMRHEGSATIKQEQEPITIDSSEDESDLRKEKPRKNQVQEEEEEEEEEEDEEEEDRAFKEEDFGPVQFTPRLSAASRRYCVSPPEYPETAKDGIAHIFNMADWPDKKDSILGDVQYSLESGSSGERACPFFGGDVDFAVYTCKGVKVCPDCSPDIQQSTHDHVDEIPLGEVVTVEDEAKKKFAEKLFNARKCPLEKNEERCLGQPLMCLSGKGRYFVGCSGWSKSNQQNHRYLCLPFNLDEKVCRYMINVLNQENPPTLEAFLDCLAIVRVEVRSCNMVHSIREQKTKCFNHENPQFLKRIGCGVKFYRILPKDDSDIGMLACTGIHTHPPPPPSKLPSGLKTKLKKKIIQDQSITAGQVILGRVFDDEDGLPHPALANTDMVHRIIVSTRKELNPEGNGLEAVVYQFLLEQKLSSSVAYIAQIKVGDKPWVLLMSQDMAKLFAINVYFTMDVAFKQVQEMQFKWKHFSVSTEHENKHRAVLRAYISCEEQQCFQEVMTAAFQHLKKLKLVANVSEKFFTTDCDLDQVIGCAKGIKAVAADERSLSEVIGSQFKACSVHFNRNMKEISYEVAGADDDLFKTVYGKLLALRTTSDAMEWESVFQQIAKYSPTRAAWWLDPNVAAICSKANSLMPREHWDNLFESTNPQEAMHNQFLRYGKHLALLHAVQLSHDIDFAHQRVSDARKRGVAHTYRPRDPAARKTENMKKAISKKAKSTTAAKKSTTKLGRGTTNSRITAKIDNLQKCIDALVASSSSQKGSSSTQPEFEALD